MTPKLCWRTPLAAAAWPGELFVDGAGRCVLCTGSYGVHPPDEEVRFYVLDRAGRLAWSAQASVRGISPENAIVAINRGFDYLAYDGDGRLLERAPTHKEWFLLGWDRGEPVLASRRGAVWVTPHVYALHDHRLVRYDVAGRVLARMPIARDRFDDALRGHTDLPKLEQMGGGWLTYPSHFALVHDARAGELVAFTWVPFAWAMRLRLDGTIVWHGLLAEACCNQACVIGDSMTVHASSCGAQVTFVARDGTIARKHQPIGAASRPFDDGCGNVWVTRHDGLTAFDHAGEPTATLEVLDVCRATARDGRLYVVAGHRPCVVSAYALV